MELLRKQTELIERLVKANPKYSGNEDLLEDFCMETYQKSYFILQSIEDFNTLEVYLKKVVASAIIDVLKINGRIIRNTNGYSAVKEILLPFDQTSDSNTDNQPLPIQDIPTEDIDIDNEEGETEEKSSTYQNVSSGFVLDINSVKDPKESIEEQVIRKDILENITNLVIQLNKENAEEMYLKLFYLRFFARKKQREIAQELKISQGEVSKRLVQLSRVIKEKLYQ